MKIWKTIPMPADATVGRNGKVTWSGSTKKYIDGTMQQVMSLMHENGIDSIVKFRRETIERWIADEIKKQVRSLRTINRYVIPIKSFVQYLTDIEVLSNNPIKSIKTLNEIVD